MRQSFAGRRKNMRPDIKDGFDKAVAADAARTTAQREVQERARTERENFKADWEHKREHVIFPAFEQIRDILMPKGWAMQPAGPGSRRAPRARNGHTTAMFACE